MALSYRTASPSEICARLLPARLLPARLLLARLLPARLLLARLLPVAALAAVFALSLGAGACSRERAVPTSDGGGGDGGGGGGSGGGGAGGGGGANDGGASCPGANGHSCPAGQFCETPPGMCAASAQATCVPKPEACTLEYAPVCGCDGTTYGNDCGRRGAGVAKDHDGACAPPADAGDAPNPADSGVGKTCGGFGGLRCPEGLFCEYPAGMCKVPDLSGVCKLLQSGCTLGGNVYACSCDGRTYFSDCERDVQKDHDGACAETCSGETSGSCSMVGAACTCCPAGGPRQHCLCSTSCASDADCHDPAHPVCNRPVNAPGFCAPADFVCCWGCK